MYEKFTMEELLCWTGAIKTKQDPGPDNITNEMLLYLGRRSRKKLIQLINTSWKIEVVPQVWRNAIIVPSSYTQKGKQYITSRRAGVTMRRKKSKQVLLRLNTPQGGMLSPTRFLIFMNDIKCSTPRSHGNCLSRWLRSLVRWKVPWNSQAVNAKSSD